MSSSGNETVKRVVEVFAIGANSTRHAAGDAVLRTSPNSYRSAMATARCRAGVLRGALMAAVTGWSVAAFAQTPTETLLPPVVVTAPPPSTSSSEQLIPGKDFELLPKGQPADILRLIPGMIIGQHQGGG